MSTKSKIFVYAETLYKAYLKYAEFNGEIWGNLVQKVNMISLNKFGTLTNWNMQNSTVMLTFYVFDQKYLFGQSYSGNSKFEITSFDT